jgi:NAD(P)-dependent dehydrogenase (short-subunit alcohol dehydrogenase family)
MTASSILVFGGRGALGAAVVAHFAAAGWRVTATSRSSAPLVDDAAAGGGVRWLRCDTGASHGGVERLGAAGPWDAVCWAQGSNLSDSVASVELPRHRELYEANCVFVIETLQALLAAGTLNAGARLVVVSSIWQRIARQDKLSYTMSKAAIGGLVQSASIDLATRGILINAVLPSVLDTPMTTANLSAEQIARVASATPFGRLVSLAEIVSVVEFLCSDQNTAITGQSIPVDLGYSHARLV